MKQFYILTILFLISFKLSGQTVSDYNLLIVDGYGSSDVKTELETLGHTATIENATNLTVSYNYSNYNTIIFMFNSAEPSGISEILSLNSSNQLGIVLLRGENLINSCDMGSSVTWSNTDFTIEDNSHFITQPFSLGTLDLGFTYKSNLTSINSGNTILGSVSTGNGSLVVNNTYRRVICPYYGHPDGMPWSSDAGILLDRIIAWTSFSQTLDLNENSLKKVKLFPNPTTDYLQISGLKNTENYRIYNVIGLEVSKGTISIDEKINVKNYFNGLYFLKLENGNTIKFVKE